jgi:sugar phosphate isomerase/epimerase
MHNKFDARLDEEVEMIRKLAKAADELGVGAIRIDVVPRKLTADQFLPFAIDACKRICDETRGSRVRFGIENHGTFTNDPDKMEKIIQGAGSDRLGITLDTANLYWWGHPIDDVYRIYGRFAPRVVHTHCKSIRYPEEKRNVKREMGWEYGKRCCPVYEGDLDFKRISGILSKAGYRGGMCIENESLARLSKAQQTEILKKEILFLRSVV